LPEDGGPIINEYYERYNGNETMGSIIVADLQINSYDSYCIG